jgi:hypothetical protein
MEDITNQACYNHLECSRQAEFASDTGCTNPTATNANPIAFQLVAWSFRCSFRAALLGGDEPVIP